MKKIFVGMSAMAIATIMGTSAFADGLKTVSVDNVQTVGALTEQLGGKIEIKENAKDSWSGTVTFKLKTPSGVKWNDRTTVNGVKPMIKDDEISFNLDGKNDIEEKITIIPYFDIERRVEKGNLDVTLSPIGSNDKSETFTVAKISDYGVNFSASNKKVPKNQKVEVEFNLKEVVENSVLPGSFYDLVIKNATIDKDSIQIKNDGGFDTLEVSKSDSKGAELKFTEKSDSKNNWKISMSVTPDKNFVGDVVATFSGKGIDKVDSIIANVYEVIKINTRTPDVVMLGKQGQKLNDIYLVETVPGGLAEGKYTLKTIPDYKGLSYIDAKVSTQDGNIIVENAKTDGNTIKFKVSGASTKASAVKISDIKATLDRVGYDGTYKLSLVNDKKPDDVIAEFDLFTVNAPTPTTTTSEVTKATTDSEPSVKFMINKKDYEVKGKAMRLDVAPYVKSGRTMLPVRAVAESLNMDTLWDKTTKEVVLESHDKKSRVVLTIGKNTMLVNGKTVKLDAAPEIKGSRTFLPLRSIAEAVGVKVDWDGATRTVTLTK